MLHHAKRKILTVSFSLVTWIVGDVIERVVRVMWRTAISRRENEQEGMIREWVSFHGKNSPCFLISSLIYILPIPYAEAEHDQRVDGSAASYAKSPAKQKYDERNLQ